MVHIRFCLELYAMQVASGQASSWEEDAVRKMAGSSTVSVAMGDQCQYGAEDRKGRPIRKPTKFRTDSLAIADTRSNRCKGRHADSQDRRQGLVLCVTGGLLIWFF